MSERLPTSPRPLFDERGFRSRQPRPHLAPTLQSARTHRDGWPARFRPFWPPRRRRGQR